jgi:Family of unknown function (DUF6298)/Putative collagen-binding domain of a collagenase
MALICAAGLSHADPATGPLRVSKENPRYFTDGTGRAVLLTGSHVWSNLVDMGPSDPPPVFDFDAYLDRLCELNHNFIRLWTWELVTWKWKQVDAHVAPHPWARTGPGKALDGKPKFDLESYDAEYFRRLRDRVTRAGEKGVYVSVMLFEGWGLQFCENNWQNHPFHPENNVNDTGRFLNAEGPGLEIHTMAHPEVTAFQEAYVRKVIDTVNDLDNVMYEISNENHPDSTEWQYHMIDLIHADEATKPKQHPVGMTFQYKGGSNRTLFESPAEWISPNNEGGYRDNPPANKGHKVVLADTDHLWGIGGNRPWVWKSFMRGLNPIFMDPHDGVVLGNPHDPQWDPIRTSMGHVRRLTEQVDLVAMTPRNGLASTTYCLADPGKEYLVYLPRGRAVTVDLTDAPGTFDATWLMAGTGKRQDGPACPGGGKREFVSPFGVADCVLHLRAR